MRNLEDVKMVINPDNSIDMHFISSDIHIPTEYPGCPNNYGAKIIAPSCGDGKTTLIKYIIKNYFSSGILVAAGTIDEVKMYGEFIKNEVVGHESNGFVLTEDDYILLYSDNESKQDEYIYSSNPDEIMNRHIVICTHYKLFNEDPRLLVCLNSNIRNLRRESVYFPQNLNVTNVRNAFGVDGYTVMSSVPRRQFIIVDEMPRCPMLKKTLTKPVLSILSKTELIDTCKHRYDKYINPRTGKEDTMDVILEVNEPIRRYCMDDRRCMYERYRAFIKGTELDPVKGTRRIDEIRSESVLDTFYDGYNNYMMHIPRVNGYLTDIPDSIDIVYNLASMAYPGMQTNLWVFDGTGDLTFKGVSNFRICTPAGTKFQSPIKFHKIDISSGRNFRESTLANNPKKIEDRLNENINILLNVFKRNPNGKILIECWKTLRFHRIENEFKEYIFSSYLYKSEKAIYLDLSRYYIDVLNPIVEQMKANGELGADFKFSFIYYQSGLDRATNEFKDYDSIIFLGEFAVPQSAIDEHNLNMGSKTDHVRYTLHQLVQAACRLRVRKHTGEPIDIYYTSDWDEKYMILLSFYMSDNTNVWKDMLEFIIRSENELTEKSFISSLKSKYFHGENNSFDFVRPKWREAIRKLCEYDSNLEVHLIKSSPYKLNIKFNELYNLIPLAIKERRGYNRLASQLKELNTELVIL